MLKSSELESLASKVFTGEAPPVPWKACCAAIQVRNSIWPVLRQAPDLEPNFQEHPNSMFARLALPWVENLYCSHGGELPWG